MDISIKKVPDVPLEATSSNSICTCESSEAAAVDYKVDISTSHNEDHAPLQIPNMKRRMGASNIDYLRIRYSIQDQILCQGGQGTIKRAYDNFT